MASGSGNVVVKFGEFKVTTTKKNKKIEIDLAVNYRPVYYSDSRPFYLSMTKEQSKAKKKAIKCRITLVRNNLKIKNKCVFLYNKEDKSLVLKTDKFLFSVCKSKKITPDTVNTHCSQVNSIR